MVKGWLGLLLLFQLWLSLPPSAAESLRGTTGAAGADADDGLRLSVDAADDALKMDEVADIIKEEDDIEPHKNTRRTSSRGLAATNDTAVALNQFHREMRLPHQTRIVGGQAANPHTNSFVVSLQDSNGNHYCGGTLVSKDCVLTAAHCTNRVTGSGPLTVVIGRSKLSNEWEGEKLQVSRELIHPKYDPSRSGYKFDGDCALLFLRRPTMTKTKIVKVNHNRYYPSRGSVVKALGWGDKDPNEAIRDPSDELHIASLRAMSNQQCNAVKGTYGDWPVAYKGVIKADMMCANHGSRDTCQGDSGGPLMQGNIQVGITSWGIGCNERQFPGVYARTSYAHKWMRRHICSRSMCPDQQWNCPGDDNEPW